MGEIADMMLDGTLCEQCGEFMDDACGHPRLCAGCSGVKEIEEVVPTKFKVRCSICSRMVKEIGLAQHLKDKHGQHKIKD